MSTTKSFRTAAESLKDVFDDAEVSDALQQQMRSRRVVKTLAAMRATKGVSQQDIAAALGVTQSKVSKLENGTDADLRFAELEAYAKTTGCDVTILFSERGKSITEQIKFHAFCIRSAFLKLAELAQMDEEIAKGVAGLHVEAFHNINRFLQESAEKLPPNPEDGQPYVRIAPCSLELSDDEDDDPVVARGPKRKSRRSRSPSAVIASPAGGRRGL